MKTKTGVIAAWVAMGLAGCGGGGKSDPEILSGVLRAGGAQGVHYATATQTGTTDANGTFKYVAGESVTFSIGAIELGEVPGSAEIELFRLAGLTPPSTELALRRELNRMRTTATPLSRAANMAWLLLALDADGNPGNGLDVRNRETALARAQVDFDVPLEQFSGELQDLAPDLNQNIPAGRAVAHLYRSFGLTVPGGVAVRRFADLQNDGQEDSLLTGTYGADGAHLRTDSDDGIDGVIDGSSRYARDVMGRRTLLATESDFDHDGAIDNTYNEIHQYDVRGNRTGFVREWTSSPLSLFDSENQVDSTFDDHGRVLTEIEEQIYPNGFGMSSRISRTFSRDADGRVRTEIKTEDLDVDDVIEFTTRIDYTYDSGGRVLTEVHELDSAAAGSTDLRQSLEHRYDAAGRQVWYRLVADNDGDGVADYAATETFAYDRAGNRTRRTFESETNVVGVVDIVSETVATFDRDHRLLTNVDTVDNAADGVLEQRYTLNNSYDANGMFTARDWLSENLTLGIVVQHQGASLSYNAQGAGQYEVYFLDFDGDGDQDLAESGRIEYEFASDALGQIVSTVFAY